MQAAAPAACPVAPQVGITRVTSQASPAALMQRPGFQQLKAVQEYIEDVKNGSFPGEEHSFNMKAEQVEELKKALGI